MKQMEITNEKFTGILFLAAIMLLTLTACSDSYYAFMEKLGIHKRDILVERVEKTQKAENKAQEEFKSALEHFASVVTVENTNLKQVYEELNAEYEDCLESAKDVSARIEGTESVSAALFQEWEQELEMFQSAVLQAESRKKLQETKMQYNEMLSLMHQAENSMIEVLFILRDNVFFLKHNLNAQAVGSLHNEYSKLRVEVDRLIQKMRRSIDSSNAFIEQMRNSS